MRQRQLRLARRQRHGLGVAIAVARLRIVDFVHEFDGILADLRRPLATVDDLKSRESACGLGGLAQHTNADLHEGFTGLGGFHTLARNEFLHRAADRIVELGIVIGIRAAEVAVPPGLQVGDHPRPVEPRGAVVTTFGTGRNRIAVTTPS